MRRLAFLCRLLCFSEFVFRRSGVGGVTIWVWPRLAWELAGIVGRSWAASMAEDLAWEVRR